MSGLPTAFSPRKSHQLRSGQANQNQWVRKGKGHLENIEAGIKGFHSAMRLLRQAISCLTKKDNFMKRIPKKSRPGRGMLMVCGFSGGKCFLPPFVRVAIRRMVGLVSFPGAKTFR